MLGLELGYVRVRVRYDRVTFDGSTLRPAGLCYG